MEPVIIVHHHEIVLKGDNRQYFERQLLKNVRSVLSDKIQPGAVTGGFGRFVILLKEGNDIGVIVQLLRHVFGLANINVGYKVSRTMEEFSAAAVNLLTGREFHTIRVKARRLDKSFPHRSLEINRRIGEILCSHFNVRANLSDPDETVSIVVLERAAYVYRAAADGAGGLPSGVSGKVVSLISAGFDSPVASWKIMKRGARAVFVHFHSIPFTTQDSVDQVRQIVQALTKYQLSSRCYLVPFAEVQQQIVLKSPQPLRVILYRRMMVRIAELIAQRENAEALVTGEAVGQVASQTLRNIRVIDAAATLPILRPLSGTDKEEIMVVARRIGTHDISAEPYDDCCSFLAPRNPETWAKADDVEQAEKNFNIPELIGLALKEVKVEQYTFPVSSEGVQPADNSAVERVPAPNLVDFSGEV